jgi:methyl-accepting chemotaxis protein WspA
LNQIIDQVQPLTGSFEIVNEGMQSQSAGAEQISEALAQLSNSVRQTVESIRASTPAIEELNGAAHGLQSGIARFMLQS